MRISWKAFLIGLALQVSLFLALWFTGRAVPDSSLDLINGILAFLVFSFYLIPIGLVQPVLYDKPIQFPIYILFVVLVVVIYALLIGIGYGVARSLKQSIFPS